MRCWNLFRNLDLLSPKIGFEYDGSSNYKSFAGAFYSFIFLVSTTVVALLFGQDFYLRTNASVSTSQAISESSSIKFNTNETFLVFGFNENSAVSDHAFSKYDIDVVSYSLKTQPNGTVSASRTVLPAPLVKCSTLNFTLTTEVENIFNFRNSTGIYCLKYSNLLVENGFGELPSTYINFRFFRCLNCSRTTPLGDYISIGLLDSFTDHSNYTYPIQYKLNSQSFQVYDGLLKHIYFRFTKNTYASDDGWILNNFSIYEYISLKSIVSDIVMIEINPSNSYPLLWITIESPRLADYTNRTYLKLQDFCANAGGFINAYFILIDLITKGHLRFIYLIFLRNLALEEKDHKAKLNNTLKLKFLERNSHVEVSEHATQYREHKISEELRKPSSTDLTIPEKRENKIKSNYSIATKYPISNNFIERKFRDNDTLLSYLSIVEKSESYLLYIWYFVSCSWQKYILYKKQFLNIEKLISISAFSKIMTYQFQDPA